jgi:hypothetical protein
MAEAFRRAQVQMSCSGALAAVLRLEYCDGVAVGALEPGRTADAGRGDDVVDSLEGFGVVVVKLDAVRGERRDVLVDVGRPETYLGVVGIVPTASAIDVSRSLSSRGAWFQLPGGR